MKENNDQNSTAELLRRIAFALLLACLVGRAFIAELPFRVNPINFATLTAQSQSGESVGPAADRTELARITFALLLLAGTALWLVAGAIEGRLKIKFPWLGAMTLFFALLSMLSVMAASDKRSAWNSWLEQTALIAAGFTAIQLCRSRRRFITLVIVVAALGATLSIKAIYQRVEEIPQRIAFFEANRQDRLAEMGIEPGQPKERMMESRIHDTTVTGFFGMANLFAAELILLLATGAGLAGAKVIHARQTRKKEFERKRGEISPSILSTSLAIIATLAIAIALALTRSRGGIAAALCVTLITTLLWTFRKKLSCHWRKVTIAIFAVFLLGLAGVTAIGLSKDRLPSKTMTMRWFYWTGSAKIVDEQPWLGVGPGNFSHAYMAVRRPEAEEEVKTPHNFIAHAFTQFGLPGGSIYILILIIFIIIAARPGLGFLEKIHPEKSANLRLGGNVKSKNAPPARIPTDIFWTFTLVLASAFLTRWIVIAGGFDANIFFVIIDCIIPATVLAIMLVLLSWFERFAKFDDLSDSALNLMRIGLATGAVGFVLHNLVSYGLWSGGTATAFWIIAGAAGGAGVGGSFWEIRKLRWPGALAGALVVIVTGIFLAGPVYRRSLRTEELARAITTGNLSRARSAGLAAASVDPLDAIARMNVARVMSIAPIGQASLSDLRDALVQAIQAMETDPQNSSAARLTGQIAQRLAQKRPTTQAKSQAAEFYARAVELDPVNSRLRLEYARVLIEAGDKRPRRERIKKARQQIDIAEELNRKLIKFDPQSSSQFGPKQQSEIRELRKELRRN